MSDRTFEDIQRLNILAVLDKLWLEYYKVWIDEYRMRWTDGWSINTADNVITDFSWKWRPVWGPFPFVRDYLKLDNKETFEWFELNFNIWNDLSYLQRKQMKEKKQYNRKALKKTWQELPSLNDKQIDYLQSRWVDHNKIKDVVKSFKGWIGCLIYDEQWPVWLTARLIEWENRFTSLAWYSTNWLYLHNIDKNKDYIIVVEWMFDFLTLRQYESNVVWLKNWSSWIDFLNKLAKKYNIILIPDNDEQWKKTLEKIWNSFDYKLVELDEFNVKDINELVVKEELWEEIIEMIFNMAVDKSNWSIELAFEELEWYEQRFKTKWMLWEPTLYPELDKYTQWFIPWNVITIWAFSNVWKSKFAYTFVNDFLEKWKKVIFFSLEVSKWMVLLNLISNKEKCKLWESIKIKEKYIDFYKNLKIYDNIYDLENIENIVKTQRPDYVFIDFVQNIQTKASSNYERYSKIAIWIQKLAIESKSTIISLSQLANESAKELKKTSDAFVSLKWAGEFYASSDLILVLRRIDEQLELIIEKNKYGKRWVKFFVDVEFETWTFKLEEDI